jgi:hypothetical protein
LNLPPGYGDGTYPYDGGPQSPVGPTPRPPKTTAPVPLQGTIASVPSGLTNPYAFPAYGEQAPVTQVATQTSPAPAAPAAQPVAQPTTRIAYPAYGEQETPASFTSASRR